jgi:proteasome lid subunit RPN8/RPN11
MEQPFEEYVSESIDEYLKDNFDNEELAATQNISILKALVEAISLCRDAYEEEGGLILEKDGEHMFVHLTNKYKHTPKAFTLYEANLDEFKNNITPRVAEGWKLKASFHTHPRFYSDPSAVDLQKLFQGFKINYIYSHFDEFVSVSVWRGDKVFTKKMFAPTEQLISSMEAQMLQYQLGAQGNQGAQGAQTV